MEGNKNRVGRKPEKEKPHLNLFVGGGAGIGGVVLLGGGFAVAAMVAAFTVIKNKRTRRRDDQNQEPATATDDSEKGDAIGGLSFVLQTPATTVNQNSCCTSHETAAIGVTVTQIDSCDLVSTHNLLLEDKPVNPGTSNQEVLLSDDSSEDSTSSYDIITTEKFSLPVPDGVPLDGLENMIGNDSVDSLQFVETIQVKKDDEAVDAEVLAREENLPMLLVGEEDEDVYGENVIEKETENSEGKFPVGENSAMQTILFSDETDQASIASGYDMLYTEDSSMAAPDGRSLDEPENMINNGSGENLQFTETIEVIEEEEAANTDKLVVEENSHVQWIEDHEEGNSCEEQVIEKEEENSEGQVAVDENLLMQVVEKEAEEETEDEISEQHAAEKVEVGSQGKLAVEDNSLTQPIQEDEDEDEDDDSGDDSSEEVTEAEEEEESSEGTGSSSMESNVEAIWSAVEEGSREKLAVEDNSLTLPIEEEDNDDSSEEVTEEEEEEVSSEGTGSSSMESNIEAIWPAGMIESPPLELKETNVNCQNSMDKIVDEDRMAKASNQDLVDCKSDGKNVSKERGSNNETAENSRMMLNKKAVQELVMAHSPNWQIWIWSMLVLLLLLLLLHIYGTSISHDSVIVP